MKMVDPDSPGPDRKTPLLYAAEHGQETIVKLVWPQTDQGTPLWWAACNGYETIITSLLTQGADPKSRSSSGETPLF
ncbi:uncharacterized protein N7473_006712 [Penicillium subrubescens]|uniref:uncharacterized protein n=1 Tax=Penicillium subrubescens TaxID=1316194 RepID=UPI0025456532|nr:uncharacterized protein N7473_006712 [Penicillium subrubescens]KAJ5890484.1 hypothetical protein N7473_006712 [Penicillium subrubescens]